MYVLADLVQQFVHVILLFVPECLGLIPVSFLVQRTRYHY